MKVSQQHDATIVRVHDGDTITAAIVLASSPLTDQDLGFHLYVTRHQLVLHAPIRLRGCNAIELNQPGGPEAQENLARFLPVGAHVTLRTWSPDKYGDRWDADVYLPGGRDLVPLLVETGWAAAWDGTGPKPVPAWPRVVSS